MDASYERVFGSKPKTTRISSPSEKGDHPETDDSPFLEEMGMQRSAPAGNVPGEIR